jgi:hypothetical protein
MKRQKLKELTEQARKFLGHEIRVTVMDDKLIAVNEMMCRFEGWTCITFTGKGAEPDLKPLAELIDLENDTKYSVSLKTIVEEFEKKIKKG